jgi:predicted NAD/FAD-binding protein
LYYNYPSGLWGQKNKRSTADDADIADKTLEHKVYEEGSERAQRSLAAIKKMKYPPQITRMSQICMINFK